MANYELLDRLLKAEDETDVDDVLKKAGYFNDDPDVWLPDAVRTRLLGTDNRAYLAIPLITEDRVIGCLTTAGRVGRVFSPEEVGPTRDRMPRSSEFPRRGVRDGKQARSPVRLPQHRTPA